MQVLPALELGGVERGTLEIAKALVENGDESVVISAGGRLVAQLEAEGSHHVTWDLGKKSLFTFLKLWSLRKWLRSEKPDIVHVRSRMPAWIVWLAWRGMDAESRPKFVTTLHGMHSVNWYSGIMGKGERVIAVSETAKRYLLENFPSVDESKVTVIHRGINPDEFPRGYQPTSEWRQKFFKTYPKAEGKKLICFPGRITRWKGHLDLVRVVELLSKERGDFHVLIVGSDPKNKFIQEVSTAIVNARLEDYFTFTGTRSDMKDIYAVSDVMLSLTSTTAEAFGRTVVECLSIGTPVVAYAHGAVKETLSAIAPEFLCTVSDMHSVKDKVMSVLNTDVEIGFNTFVLDRMTTKTLSLYGDVVVNR